MAQIPPIVLDVQPATLAKLDLRPQDGLVLHVSFPLSQDQRIFIRQEMERLFPGRLCVVVPAGAQLDILRGPDLTAEGT